MSVGWWCKCCGGIKITHHVPLENQRWHVPTSATEWNRLKKEVRHYMELALKFGGGRADT